MSQKNKYKTELADFTTIKHNPRVKYDLSNNDYCIASAIFTLSHNKVAIKAVVCSLFFTKKVEPSNKNQNIKRIKNEKRK